MPTAKQTAARKKFKEKVNKAKVIKARHPNMKFSTAIQIAYGKKKEQPCKTKKCKRKTKK